jgi:diamine N-acetyltransferase
MDENRYHLRYATAADNVVLAEVGAETFAATFAADNTPEDIAAYLVSAFGPDIQARELADPANRFMILAVNVTFAGYCQVRFAPAVAAVTARHPMEIGRIYVRQAWIGIGVGARLMSGCLHEAEQAGCDVVWLGVWERNPRAIAFYHKWGFKQVGTQTFQLGADTQTDWVMVRRVNAHPGDAGRH